MPRAKRRHRQWKSGKINSSCRKRKNLLRADTLQWLQNNLGKENENNCIICLGREPTPEKPRLWSQPINLISTLISKNIYQPTTLTQNVGVVLVLKDILKLSKDELNTFIEDSGGLEPKDWVPLCSKCMFEMNQIGVISGEIKRLEGIIEAGTKVIMEIWKQSESEATEENETEESEDTRREKRKALVHEKILERNPKNKKKKNPPSNSSGENSSNLNTSGLDGGNEPESEHMNDDNDTFSMEEPMEADYFPNEENKECTESEPSDSNPKKDVEIEDEASAAKEDANVSKKRTRVPEIIIDGNRKIIFKEYIISSDNPEGEEDIVPPPEEKPLEFKNVSLGSKYTCKSCPEHMPMGLDSLLTHIIFHWKRPNKCSKCNVYLPLQQDLIEDHWKKFHSDTVPPPDTPKYLQVEASPMDCWECVELNCKEVFMTCAERDQHERDHHGFVAETPEACVIEECPSRFRSIQEVRLHMALEHPEATSLCCCYCEKSLAVPCKDSNIQVRDIDLFESHVLSAHPKHTKKAQGFKGKKEDLQLIPLFLQDCPVCGVVCKFSSANSLDAHLKNCHGVHMAFNCSICSLDMTYSSYWNHFQRYHSSPVICDTCGDLVMPRHLTLHLIRKHGVMEGQEDNIQMCTDCDFITLRSIKGSMRLHMNKHKTDRPYKCEFCEKTFKTRDQRREHEKIHRNKDSRPFQCDLCGSSFAIKTYLYTHKRLTHQGRKYPSTNRKRSAQSSSSATSRTRQRMPRKKQEAPPCNSGSESETANEGSESMDTAALDPTIIWTF